MMINWGAFFTLLAIALVVVLAYLGVGDIWTPMEIQ